nr:MAG TPA: hypothetical protein [Caudoviricetes sp.]
MLYQGCCQFQYQDKSRLQFSRKKHTNHNLLYNYIFHK